MHLFLTEPNITLTIPIKLASISLHQSWIYEAAGTNNSKISLAQNYDGLFNNLHVYGRLLSHPLVRTQTERGYISVLRLLPSRKKKYGKSSASSLLFRWELALQSCPLPFYLPKQICGRLQIEECRNSLTYVCPNGREIE